MWITMPEGTIDFYLVNLDGQTFEQRKAAAVAYCRRFLGQDPVSVDTLPYGASPKFDAQTGKRLGVEMGDFCHQPHTCKGKGSCPCPRGRSCSS